MRTYLQCMHSGYCIDASAHEGGGGHGGGTAGGRVKIEKGIHAKGVPGVITGVTSGMGSCQCQWLWAECRRRVEDRGWAHRGVARVGGVRVCVGGGAASRLG